jgi:uncharacterized protein YajQ (UPF0234 family)
MNPIHPVSFPTVFHTILNGPERQPGREEHSLSNSPPTQRRISTQTVQIAATHVGVPERITDTGQTGSNVQRQQWTSGSDSFTTLNSIPFAEIQPQANAELSELARQFQSANSIESILGDLQATAKEAQTGLQLTGEATVELQELIQMIKQISKDSKAIDQVLEFIEGNPIQQNPEAAQLNFGGVVAQAVGDSQQAQANLVAQESIAFTHQFEITLSSITNDDGEEEPERVMRVQMDGAEVVHTEVFTVRQSDPLVLDLDGDGIELSHVKDGVLFDINADGQKDQTAFVSGGDAFLALDRNYNGLIDDGSELFGDQNGAFDGFEELRKYDNNKDGIINSEDPVFHKLRLFGDDNRDGFSQLGEIHTLQQKRIEAILLDSAQKVEFSVNENHIIKAGSFVLKDGSEHRLADALLNYGS